jgi:hypothetical protein
LHETLFVFQVVVISNEIIGIRASKKQKLDSSFSDEYQGFLVKTSTKPALQSTQEKLSVNEKLVQENQQLRQTVQAQKTKFII